MSDLANIQRIGVLTSGGDAPGMNAAIRAVVRASNFYGVECLGIRRGYNGLINGDIFRIEDKDVGRIISRGGTMLYTARCPEFMTEEGQKRAADTCKYMGIDAIVCIGGDGTFRGAKDLARIGGNCIGLPATIDNDIACSHYSIGFDTACNTALDAIDKLRDTMQSHERCSVIELMGRSAGHLALYVGIACGATAVLVPERPVNFERDVIDKIREARIKGRSHFLIIIAEGVGNASEIAEKIKEVCGLDPRVTILGHVQRGGTPTARDRVTASRLGHFAVKIIMDGERNRVVSIKNGELHHYGIEEGLAMTRGLQQTMYETCEVLTGG